MKFFQDGDKIKFERIRAARCFAAGSYNQMFIKFVGMITMEPVRD